MRKSRYILSPGWSGLPRDTHIADSRKKQIFNKGCIPLIKATSSGTSGRKSMVAFDTGGLLCGLKMVMRVSKLRNLLSPVPCHYIIMGYKHHRGNKTAVTKTAFGATFFTPALSRNYILTYKKGGYSPRL